MAHPGAQGGEEEAVAVPSLADYGHNLVGDEGLRRSKRIAGLIAAGPARV